MESATNSGDGSRPTTDGGVDNIGGADTFVPRHPDNSSPRPPERMSEVRKDKASVKKDDSAPFGLTEGTEESTNTEPPARP